MGVNILNIQLLSFVAYFGYFLIGIVSFIISPTLPLIIEDFRITVGVAGVIFTAYAAGTFVGGLFGGYISDIAGKKTVINLGCILHIIGFLLTAATGSWILVLFFVCITGLGRGVLNTCLNALIADIHQGRRGSALNTLHGIYGAGSLIGPILAGLVLSLNYHWRVVYYGAAVVWIIFLLIIMPIKYPSVSDRFTSASDNLTTGESNNAVKSYKGVSNNNHNNNYNNNYNNNHKNNHNNNYVKSRKNTKIGLASVKLIILNPIFIMLFFVSFIYNGAATGLIGWINTYLDGINFSVILGSGMVSVFYLGLTLGRFACRFLSEKIGYSKTILSCALGCFVFYPFTIFASNPLMITAGVFFSGLFFSGLHPTGLAYANSMFPSISGTVTGILYMAMSLGSMTIPWLIGLVAEKESFKAGFSISYTLIVILVGIAISLLLRERKKMSVT